MPDKVVDASALAAILFGEPEGSSLAETLWASRLFAPALIWLELANVCVTKIRRSPLNRDELVRQYFARGAVRIETVEIEPDGVVELAISTGLTAYDASYLWLARAIDADLVTLDRTLARVASS